METKTITFDGLPTARIAEVVAIGTRIYDEHTILERVGGKGHVVTFTVTFGNMVECTNLTREAYSEIQHLFPCDPPKIR